MSEATAKWQSGLDQAKFVIIHGLDDEHGTSDIILRDGEYLSKEEAARIVRDHNAHDSLVGALEKIQVETQDPAIEKLCAAALEETKR